MRRQIVLKAVLGIGLGVSLAACGPKEPEKVEVKLTEFTIESSRTDFQTGIPYQFEITNEGAIEHEFMIMPAVGEGSMTMEMGELDNTALAMVEADKLPPGATQTVTLTFDNPASPGSLEFACHVKGHYEQSMRMPITVRP